MSMNRNITPEEAVKIAMGGASSPSLPLDKRKSLVSYLSSTASAYIYALSAVAHATHDEGGEIHTTTIEALDDLDKKIHNVLSVIIEEDSDGKTDQG